MRQRGREETRREEEEEERRKRGGGRGGARDSWQPVAKGHQVLAPLLHARLVALCVVVGGYRDVLILQSP